MLEKIGGGGAKDNRPLFFKTIGYCFYCSFYCFSKILGGQTPSRGAKSFWGAPPAPPVAESQSTLLRQIITFKESKVSKYKLLLTKSPVLRFHIRDLERHRSLGRKCYLSRAPWGCLNFRNSEYSRLH